jgi:hypothetical protein
VLIVCCAEVECAQRYMKPLQMRRIPGHLDNRDINRAHAGEIKITKNNMSCVKGSDKIVEDHVR